MCGTLVGMPPPRARRRRRLGSTLLAAGLLIGLGALLAYGLGSPQLVPVLGGRIPAVAYDAYRAASRLAPTVAPACEVHWTVVAGIAQVESRHGQLDGEHALDPDGDVVPSIRGRALDGTSGTEPIFDTDDGELDGDRDWDRAMGPLQFIPTTWQEIGRDGNDDGRIDPDNLYDAALTAVAHLCEREPGDYDDRRELRRALLAYNASGRYADDVLAWIGRYAGAELDEIIEQPSDDAEA
jgi:membrane-bound lytic murein transglycosylase B